MPPKRSKIFQGGTKGKKNELSKEDLQCLIKDHRIGFEGPVSEKHLPSRYKHLFQAIRRIHTICYEDRKHALSYFQKERVRHIRLKARNLRENTKVYESEWRDAIENYLMRLFHEEVVCYRCNGEKWESALEALPFTKEQQVQVLESRAARKPCRCNQREVRPTPESDDSDDEGQTLLFETALGQAISHGQDDDLDGYSISMTPDRVVGLRLNGRYRRYIGAAPSQLMHTCLKEKSSLLYPFLVLEAKREQDAPGFQSIGQQTAFPIRRMLQTQQSLLQKAAESISEPPEYLVDPLVWFLCNQGEIWRLYAAVIEGPDILELLRRYWTADTGADNEDLASADTGEVIQALLLFRTFCQPTGWQITRELSVFAYGVQAVQALRHLSDYLGFHNRRHMERLSQTWRAPSHHNFKAVLVEVQKVRNLSGISSVMHAFRGTRAVLGRDLNRHDPANHLKWTTPTDTKLHADSVRGAFAFFDGLAQIRDMPPRIYSTTTGLLQVIQHGQTTSIQDSPFVVPPDAGDSGAVIGIRPTSWPLQCPNFCLFVLERIDQLDKVSLARLLEATIRIRNFFAGGEGPIAMDRRDKLLLAEWVKAMKE
ncbi:hypothetical protein CLAIMM_14842 [Cladophialophora immunda]|nr:hypothetical protein CLAIMM_14842 [Cladophialophora immunda]